PLHLEGSPVRPAPEMPPVEPEERRLPAADRTGGGEAGAAGFVEPDGRGHLTSRKGVFDLPLARYRRRRRDTALDPPTGDPPELAGPLEKAADPFPLRCERARLHPQLVVKEGAI